MGMDFEFLIGYFPIEEYSKFLIHILRGNLYLIEKLPFNLVDHCAMLTPIHTCRMCIGMEACVEKRSAPMVPQRLSDWK